MNIPNILATKCPKCNQRNVAIVKESFIKAVKRNLFNVMFPIRFLLGYAKAPKPLYVCRACGFDWEKR